MYVPKSKISEFAELKHFPLEDDPFIIRARPKSFSYDPMTTTHYRICLDCAFLFETTLDVEWKFEIIDGGTVIPFSFKPRNMNVIKLNMRGTDRDEPEPVLSGTYEDVHVIFFNYSLATDKEKTDWEIILKSVDS
jgi:hypothetical protein